MSIRSRIRKKQRRNFESRLRLNAGYDRNFGDWKLIDIHPIPIEIHKGNEFDFWCHNKKDLYLLRLRKGETEQYSVIKSYGKESVIYLVVEYDFNDLNNEVIREIIEGLEQKNIPNWVVNSINRRL